MRKSNIIKASRMWIYWKLANIPFYLGKWYIIFYLITLWTEKHHRFNPGKTVVTCLEIFPGSAEFHGKYVSVKNKHFQNSCKFGQKFFFFGRLQIPRPPTVYFTSTVFRKTNSHACQNTLFSLSTFFSFTLGKNQQRLHLELRELWTIWLLCVVVWSSTNSNWN